MINYVHSLIIFASPSLPASLSPSSSSSSLSLQWGYSREWIQCNSRCKKFQLAKHKTHLENTTGNLSIPVYFSIIHFDALSLLPNPLPSPTPPYRRLYQPKYTWCILSNQANFGRSSRAVVGTTRRRASLNSLWVKSSVAQLLGELKGAWGPSEYFGDIWSWSNSQLFGFCGKALCSTLNPLSLLVNISISALLNAVSFTCLDCEAFCGGETDPPCWVQPADKRSGRLLALQPWPVDQTETGR